MSAVRRDPPGRRAPEPWSPGPSIFDALKAFEGGAFELPDAPATPERLRFADGLLDGAGIADDDPSEVSALVEAVERLLKHPGPQLRRALYERLAESRALIASDPLLEALAEKKWVRQGMLAPHARWLVHVAAHREPLKFGLVLLGASGGPEDLPDLEIAARSDEFTLFSAIAAGNLLEDPRDVWWRMAKRVHGWGRVTSVAMLAPRCGDRPDIRAWLVREACRSELGLELAFGCAEHGGLREQLEKTRVDAALLDGACHLLGLLCDPLAPRGLDEFKDALPAIRALMRHLERRCDSLERLSFARELHRWLEWPHPVEGEPPADPDRWLSREQDGWTRAARAELAWACERLAAQGWEAEIRAAAASDEPSRRCLGWELAEWRGIDVWEAGFERLQSATTDDFLWFKLARSADPARLERLRKLAEAVLPLETARSEPMGIAGDPVSRCHGFLLQEIKAGRFWSEKLVRAGLSSPLVRNRHLALLSIEHRPRADWGEAIEEAVNRALFEETDEALRELLRRLARAR